LSVLQTRKAQETLRHLDFDKERYVSRRAPIILIHIHLVDDIPKQLKKRSEDIEEQGQQWALPVIS
jgi:hypothetical protein